MSRKPKTGQPLKDTQSKLQRLFDETEIPPLAPAFSKFFCITWVTSSPTDFTRIQEENLEGRKQNALKMISEQKNESEQLNSWTETPSLSSEETIPDPSLENASIPTEVSERNIKARKFETKWQRKEKSWGKG